MNVAAAIAMYQRRATVVGWLHASPLAAAQIDPLTQGPKASLGTKPPDGYTQGAFGESFAAEVKIRAYTRGKVSSAFVQQYGFVEGGDMELCVIVPFQPDAASGIAPLTQALEAAYNDGQFATVADSPTLAAFDRFRFAGKLWVAKAPAIPIIDGDTTLAYRILVTKLTT